MIDEKQEEKVIQTAHDMLDQAYVPYSKFPVGAALLAEDGTIYGGCNIENASYGLTNCAERTALFRAIADGQRKFRYLVITAHTDRPVSPCGACRQIISEFCKPDMPILLMNTHNDRHLTQIDELLPGYFKPEDMIYENGE